MSPLDSLAAALTQRKQQHLYRSRPLLESAQGARVCVDGKNYHNFCSNDYLGLANHPQVIAAFQQAANDYGVGSGGSHLVCGHSRLHHQLEEELAAFTGRDRVLLFSTGYMANLGIINALVGKQDAVFEDKLNHASLLDGGLLSGAKFQRFLHNDVASLAKKLSASTATRKLIVVDGVFSMDGDCAPLTELAALAQQQNAWLMVDDAHGFGVLGEQGAGCAEHFQLDQQQLPILMATLGKAAGSFGAFVAGSEVLIETLIQFARPYIYTTALPPAVAAASLASLAVIRDDRARRQKLQHLIGHFKQQAQAQGIALMPSDTAIQPLLIGDSAKALAISQALAAQGFMVGAIRPPTVPNNTARLRITLTADHSEQHINDLVVALAQIMAELC
ncbi:8-amino-7-oxononanoate synthase [Dasania sp. GY-MA-18]|uniref:8-amino-7-oxononanoate synthase n=1 Tax=Dasania phycosphaerae TaxID=2950436 RepID=A0A9J6RK92_9GAMM|nr:MULTISPECIES: 8-amino-7-oxononanoate synthase [Dasania]MCR8922398.1 8-amino-7-oxononanoate synthase [Dasania sp. GY-MA-18]MCZ0864826.1 8-amino-7-oxononanoate synthase [Dasania phycosphaerae]MCZ0868554.1 8-amino-7-oxononanoate synthase [Dasania phycosphaerae]